MGRSRDQLNGAAHDGLLPICSSPNDFRHPDMPIDKYPAMFAGTNDWGYNTDNRPLRSPAVSNLLTVGSVDNTGRRMSWSKTADYVRQYAPGNRVAVAGRAGTHMICSGSSLAAPAVAGVAAYIASLPEIYEDWDASNLDSFQRVQSLYELLVRPAKFEDDKLVAGFKWPRSYSPGDPNFPDAIWNGVTREGYLSFDPHAP